MRFSIRTLLALMFLIGLSLLTWRTVEEVRRDSARLERMRAEIKDLESRVRTDDPELHQVILNTRDDFASLQAMRQRATQQFDVLREKYSHIEQRGSDVLSIRGLPALRADDGPVPIVFRMIVPEDRATWLKLGVHMGDASQHSSRADDAADELLTDSPFETSGPFEWRLPAGDHRLEIAIGAVEKGALPVKVELDNTILWQSKYVSDTVSSMGASHISAPEQIDYGPDRELPWLLTAHMNHRGRSGDDRAETHAFSIWLSDRTSAFKAFPTHDN